MSGAESAPPVARAASLPLRLANLSLLLCIYGMLAASLYPGRFDGDTKGFYEVVCALSIHNWHMPLAVVLLRLLTFVASGPAPMFFFQLGVWFAGQALLTDRLILLGWPLAALGMSALILFPLTAFETVEIQKDVTLTALATLIAALGLRSLTGASAGGTNTRAAWRKPVPWILPLFVLAIDIRKNGFCLLFGLLFLFLPIRRLGWRPAIIGTGLALVALIGIGITADFIDYSLLKAQRPHEISSLVVFDLAGISARTGTDTSLGLLPDFAASASRCYTPVWWDTFLSGDCSNLGHMADLLMRVPSSSHAFLHAWEAAIIGHPIAYLAHRLTYFSCFARIACPTWITHPVMSGGIAWPRPWETTPYKPTSAGLILERWSNGTAASPLGYGWLWLLASFATSAVAARQLWIQGFSPIPYFVMVVSGSACFYTAMFAVGGVASALRYLHVTMVFCMITLPLSAGILLRPARHHTNPNA